MINIGFFTFRELIRQRLIHVALFLALLMFAVSFLLGSLTMDETNRILFHFGFSAVQLGVIGLSLIMGAYTIPKEIERQTCLIVLARPISRIQFFVGKWIGVSLINLCVVGILTVVVWLLIGGQFSFISFFKVGAGIYFESSVVLALAFFGSQVLRPAATGLFFSIGIFILGHWLEELNYFAEKSKIEIYKEFARLIHWIVPHLYAMDWKSYYLLEHDLIPSSEFASVALHSLGWTVLLLSLGAWGFRRKDLV